MSSMLEVFMIREKFQTRTIRLIGQMQLNTALLLLPNLPIDAEKPLVITIGEEAKPRGLDANALMWVGPLADIAAQGWVGGHQMSEKTWHEIFKEAYLPEAFDEDLTKKGYEKWGYKPNGDRVLIGSTTELTVKGFAMYLEQVYSDGASLGVEFRANPNDSKRGL